MDKDKKLFPQRLWELVNDEKYNFCLRWSPDGQRIFLNRNEFETHYLRTSDNQFHTQKAISFVRQMNMYGFRKVDDCYYENDNFKKNCHHLLKYMIRRHSNRNNPAGTLNEIHQQNTNRLDAYNFANISQWNINGGSESGARVGDLSGADNNNSMVSSCGYGLSDRQSARHIVSPDNNNILISARGLDNADDTDSDVDISGEVDTSGDNNDSVDNVRRQNENQIASIQSLFQQFARPNRATSRNSVDYRRLSEQSDPLRHLTLASQNNTSTACSMGNLNQATVAGLNANGISQSTLASTLLYEQLAELNFGSTHGHDLFQEHQYQQQPHQMQQQQQQQQYLQQTQPKRQRRARSDVTLDATTNTTQNLQHPSPTECLTPQQIPVASIPQSQSPQLIQAGVPRNQSVPSTLNEQSLAVHQAVLEQTLIRSLLQHQQSVSASLHQNLLESLRQQSNSMIPFNQLPASAANPSGQSASVIAGATSSPNTSNQSLPTNVLSRDSIMRPLELVVNSSASSSNSEHESFARRMSLESHLCRVRNEGAGYTSNTTPTSNISGPSQLNSPRYKRGIEVLDEDDDCRPPCQDDGQFSQTRSASHKRSSSSGSPCLALTPQSRRLEDLQDEEDSNYVILDLAKPKSPPPNEKENTTDDKT